METMRAKTVENLGNCEPLQISEFNRGIILLQHAGISTHFVLQRITGNTKSKITQSFSSILGEGKLTLNHNISCLLQNAGVNIFTEELLKLGFIDQVSEHKWRRTHLYVPLLDCGRMKISSVDKLSQQQIDGVAIYPLGDLGEEIAYNSDPFFLAIAARLFARKIIC